MSTEGSKHKCNDDDHTTLQQILLHHKSTFCNGIKYSERNTGTEVLKAIAITLFRTAASSWGTGILEGAHKAADVTEASVLNIHKWTAMYFVCTIGTAAEKLNDTAVEILL